MYTVILFTNRILLVFDADGNQCDYQAAISCYPTEDDLHLLQELLAQDCRFYIAKWKEWKHEISKREFEYLLGQRTREKDLGDLKREHGNN